MILRLVLFAGLCVQVIAVGAAAKSTSTSKKSAPTLVREGSEICPLLSSIDPARQGKGGVGGEKSLLVELSPTIQIPAMIEMTSKGHGILKIANLELMIYDDHNDGTLFEPRCVNILMEDRSGDGIKDLELSGTLAEMDDNKVLATSVMQRTYIFSRQRNRFNPRGAATAGPMEISINRK